MEKDYTVHCIYDTNNNGIMVELGIICLIKYFKIWLWDRVIDDILVIRCSAETRNTVNHIFHVVSLKAMHLMNILSLVGGVVAPMNHVATIKMGTSVVEGVSRTPNVLLDANIVY
ncbi:BTB/POZ domain-containing protein 9-like isoform 1-T6 [Glossina fuscipes fuscipes]